MTILGFTTLPHITCREQYLGVQQTANVVCKRIHFLVPENFSKYAEKNMKHYIGGKKAYAREAFTWLI